MYRVEIHVVHNNVWQTMHVEVVAAAEGTAEHVAEAVANNQNVTDGEDWRVRVYIGDDDTHVGEAGPLADGLSLTTLGFRLRALGALAPIERARQSAALADEARQALARVRYAAVYEATRVASYAEVAAALGISAAAVNKLITTHRRG